MAEGTENDRVWKGEVTSDLKSIKEGLAALNAAVSCHLANCARIRDGFQGRVSRLEEGRLSDKASMSTTIKIIGIIIAIISVLVTLGLIKGGI